MVTLHLSILLSECHTPLPIPLLQRHSARGLTRGCRSPRVLRTPPHACRRALHVRLSFGANAPPRPPITHPEHSPVLPSLTNAPVLVLQALGRGSALPCRCRAHHQGGRHFPITLRRRGHPKAVPALLTNNSSNSSSSSSGSHPDEGLEAELVFPLPLSSPPLPILPHFPAPPPLPRLQALWRGSAVPCGCRTHQHMHAHA
jgi:hypothetical protein